MKEGMKQKNALMLHCYLACIQSLHQSSYMQQQTPQLLAH